MRVLKALELACEHIGKADVKVAFQLFVLEFLTNEIVQFRGIIETILIEKAEDHTPVPTLDEVIVPVAQLMPEVLHLRDSLLLATNWVLRENVCIDGADGDAAHDGVLCFADGAKVSYELLEDAHLVGTKGDGVGEGEAGAGGAGGYLHLVVVVVGVDVVIIVGFVVGIRRNIISIEVISRGDSSQQSHYSK